jgi:hypothetical protein
MDPDDFEIIPTEAKRAFIAHAKKCSYDPETAALRLAQRDNMSGYARCKTCLCVWCQWKDGSWSLAPGEIPGPCCDNAPMQLEAVPVAPHVLTGQNCTAHCDCTCHPLKVAFTARAKQERPPCLSPVGGDDLCLLPLGHLGNCGEGVELTPETVNQAIGELRRYAAKKFKPPASEDECGVILECGLPTGHDGPCLPKVPDLAKGSKLSKSKYVKVGTEMKPAVAHIVWCRAFLPRDLMIGRTVDSYCGKPMDHEGDCEP